MSFAHKVVLLVMQQRGYFVTEQIRQNFFYTLFFCGKAKFHSANLTSRGNFFNEIVRGAYSKNACKLTEYQ